MVVAGYNRRSWKDAKYAIATPRATAKLPWRPNWLDKINSAPLRLPPACPQRHQSRNVGRPRLVCAVPRGSFPGATRMMTIAVYSRYVAFRRTSSQEQWIDPIQWVMHNLSSHWLVGGIPSNSTTIEAVHWIYQRQNPPRVPCKGWKSAREYGTRK